MNGSRMPAVLLAVAALCSTDGAPLRADTYAEGLAAQEQGQYQRALDLWFPLALAGHCRAQFGLGELAIQHRLYAPSLRIEFDSVTAAKLKYDAAEYWLTEAAEQGHAGAMRELAGFYASRLVHLIYPEALEKMDFWYRRAAESGDLASMHAIIQKYYHSDALESLKWELLLKDHGDPLGNADAAIAVLSQRLTEDQVRAARRFAREWEPDRHPPTPGGPCE